jgi:hypothetical protein
MEPQEHQTPAQLRARLVTALRSRQYVQGKDRLRVSTQNGIDAFCCLGVACDVFDADRWTERYRQPWYGNADPYLPHDVATAFGWDQRASVCIEGRHKRWVCLAELNDSGLTFEQIADVIEAGYVNSPEPPEPDYIPQSVEGDGRE